MANKLFLTVVVCWLAVCVPVRADDDEFNDIFQFFDECFVSDTTDYVSSVYCDAFKAENDTRLQDINAAVNLVVNVSNAILTEKNSEADQLIADASVASTTSTAFLSESYRSLDLHPRHRVHHHRHRGHKQSAAERHYAESHEFGEIPYLFKELWPNANVYFTVATGTKTLGTVDVTEPALKTKAAIAQAIQMWETTTCMDFTEVAENDPSNGAIVLSGRKSSQSSGCSSQGAPTGAFPGTGKYHGIWLSPPSTCPVGTIAHELGHAMGLEHTMQRTDAKKFVKFITTSSGWARWGSQYDVKTGSDYKELPTDSIPGANNVERAKNYYKSIMMYPADDEMQPVPDYWAANKDSLTSDENALLTDIKDDTKYMGQRTLGVTAFDAAVINDAYSCFPLKLKAAYASVFGHLGQTALQMIKKIQQQKKTAGVKVSSVQLFTTDESVASNEVAYTTTLTNATQEYIVKILDKCITFKTTDKSYELCVDLTWKLPRVTSNLLTFHKINVATYSKDSTAISDVSKTLTELGLDGGQNVDITLS